ncbi:uncharacterized protein [Ptychodera flava]|uniref:uncharacterized protein n=1 Tax=Ptychodera flava TaxID=63121 RepID=UPI00396A1E75
MPSFTEASSKASGVPVDEKCVCAFEDLKSRHKFKYVILRVSDDNKKIITEATVETGSWEDYCKNMPADECRYGVYDFNYVLPDGGARNKVVFIAWAPDTANVKKKMVFSSSKDALIKKLNGIQHIVQASDKDELDYEEIKDKISKGGTN